MSKIVQDSSNNQFLNIQNAAKFLDVNPTTIRRWAQQGKLKGVKIGSRGDWRFTKNDLLEMVGKGNS